MKKQQKDDINEIKEVLSQLYSKGVENMKKQKEVMLNPNCSEIVWRLESVEGRTWTDGYPNDCVESMASILDELNDKEVKQATLTFVDNNGGGGNWDYVEKCFEIAQKLALGKITEKEAVKLERKLWG
jgi:hypothetical protein